MKTRKNHILIKSMLLASTVIIAPTAYGQDADDKAIEEITITATKRSTSLNDTGLAVTALTDEFRDRSGLQGAQDIADFTPGVSAEDTPNRLSIRGVGRLTNALGTDPGVAMYLDGVYESELAIFGMSTLTVDRIEVLRGPQGTLYGRNSVGGAVNVISRRPADEWEAEARALFGNYQARNAGVRISGPISDNIRMLVWGETYDQDGFQKNIGIGEDKWGVDSATWEAQIEMDLSEKFSIWAKYGSSTSDNPSRHVIKLNDYDTTTFSGSLVHNPRLGYTETNPSVADPFVIRSDYDGRTKVSNHERAAVELTYAGEKISVKYLYGSQKYDYDESVDIDYTDRTDSLVYPDPSGDPFAGFVSLPNQNINTLGEYKRWDSHEFQISSNGDSKVDWIIGAYQYDENVRQPYHLSNPNNIYLQNPRFPDFSFATAPYYFEWYETEPNPGGDYYFQEGELRINSKALFGELSVDFSEKFTLKGGLRYTKDEKWGNEDQRQIFDLLSNSFDPLALGIILGGGSVSTDALGASPWYQAYSYDVLRGTVSDSHEASWSAWSGNLSAEFRPNETTLFYATVSKGYKSGGFRLGGLSDDPATSANEAEVGEEKLWAYEVGLKKGISDNAQLNLAGFYYDYSGLQSEVPIYRAGVPLIELYNAEKARSMGFEAELVWAPSANTTIVGTYSYMDAEFTDFCGSDATTAIDGSKGCLVDATGGGILYDPTGNRLNRAPKHKFAANVSHVVDIKQGSLTFSGTFSHVGKQHHSVFPSAATLAPSYNRADARIMWTDKKERFDLVLTMRNVFDTLAMSSAGAGTAPYYNVTGSFNPPRTYSAEWRMRF